MGSGLRVFVCKYRTKKQKRPRIEQRPVGFPNFKPSSESVFCVTKLTTPSEFSDFTTNPSLMPFIHLTFRWLHN
ncbi:hypothetical protein J6590_009284 [Homalodisca vitripennis]|nr:hypothetical protein J6590_009284 [Homalodisca vitripennis]